jgi:hypothetical protein
MSFHKRAQRQTLMVPVVDTLHPLERLLFTWAVLAEMWRKRHAGSLRQSSEHSPQPRFWSPPWAMTRWVVYFWKRTDGFMASHQRSAVCSMVLDSSGNLIGGVADMDLVQLIEPEKV